MLSRTGTWSGAWSTGHADEGIPAGDHVFDLVAITIALSIVLHSSTDVPVAKALRVEPPDNLPTGQPGPADDRS